MCWVLIWIQNVSLYEFLKKQCFGSEVKKIGCKMISNLGDIDQDEMCKVSAIFKARFADKVVNFMGPIVYRRETVEKPVRDVSVYCDDVLSMAVLTVLVEDGQVEPLSCEADLLPLPGIFSDVPKSKLSDAMVGPYLKCRHGF